MSVATDAGAIKRVLKELIRQDGDQNQKTVAAAVGVAPSYLSQVLSGDRMGGIELLTKIAAQVGYSLGELELMAAGIDVDPAAYRARLNALVDQCKEKERMLSILHKLLAAERVGLLSEIEHYLDFSLSKVKATGRVAAAIKQAK
jgi:transcriptional regulator with XRE-family HTH domain